MRIQLTLALLALLTALTGSLSLPSLPAGPTANPDGRAAAPAARYASPNYGTEHPVRLPAALPDRHRSGVADQEALRAQLRRGRLGHFPRVSAPEASAGGTRVSNVSEPFNQIP